MARVDVIAGLGVEDPHREALLFDEERELVGVGEALGNLPVAPDHKAASFRRAHHQKLKARVRRSHEALDGFVHVAKAQVRPACVRVLLPPVELGGGNGIHLGRNVVRRKHIRTLQGCRQDN